MYFPYFITYMAIGFLISIVVFFWALNNGQFRDQKRARYLPLADTQQTETLKVSRINRIEAYALGALVCTGLLSTVAVLVFSLVRGN